MAPPDRRDPPSEVWREESSEALPGTIKIAVKNLSDVPQALTGLMKIVADADIAMSPSTTGVSLHAGPQRIEAIKSDLLASIERELQLRKPGQKLWIELGLSLYWDSGPARHD